LAVRALAFVPALAVLAIGAAAQWEMSQGAPSEHVHDLQGPGATPPALDFAAGEARETDHRQADHLPLVPGSVEGDDGGRLVANSPATLYPTVTSESVVAAATVRGGALTEAEMTAVLVAARWPEELLAEALTVSYGESVGWQPRIMGDSGRAYGLFQIHADPWAGWCGVTAEQLLDPLPNATCARRIVTEYEAARGYQRWSNWSVKPW